jgi:protein-S-isoprenylcysteine O-methyltransferase Ste14
MSGLAGILGRPISATLIIWATWYATWIAAVVFSGRTQVQMRTDAVGLPRFLAGFGCILLFTPASGWAAGWPLANWWLMRLWPASEPVQWGLVAGVAAGFAFCWWARLHLGRLWSGFVTLKEDHRIVETGPYGLVRHPIYAGAMASALMTAAIEACPLAFAGFGLFSAGFAMVARVEERFLKTQLGDEVYDPYAARVGMLLPRFKI